MPESSTNYLSPIWGSLRSHLVASSRTWRRKVQCCLHIWCRRFGIHLLYGGSRFGLPDRKLQCTITSQDSSDSEVDDLARGITGLHQASRVALSEFESKRVEKLASQYVEAHRPPAHIRSELDLGFRISGQSLVFFEVRPRWDNPSQILEQDFAKTTFVKKTRSWKIFWMRQDLKWHRYEPVPEVASLEAFLSTLSEDALGCFRG